MMKHTKQVGTWDFPENLFVDEDDAGWSGAQVNITKPICAASANVTQGPPFHASYGGCNWY